MNCVLLQIIIKRKLDVISFIYRISRTKQREICTTCSALLGFVDSVTKYEHNEFGSDISFNPLNEHKPIFSCSAEKGNLSPENISAQMQLTKFKKIRIIYTKGKSFR